MNKKLLSFLTLVNLIICNISIAQTVITSNGVNYTIGKDYTVQQSTSSVSPGSAGANQTWDLSSISNSTPNQVTFVAASSTSYASSFPNANVAWTTQQGSVSYYKVTSSALQLHGVATSGVLLAYSNPEDMIRFPFEYNDSYTDTWKVQFSNAGYTFYRTGTTTVTADGYGTLITPNGTYTDVLRVHYVQNYQDSANIGGPYIITYNNDEYMWYKNGIKMQLASTFTFTSSATSPSYGSSYLSGNVGIEDNSDLTSISSIYPNPASDKLNIEVYSEKSQEMKISIFNSLGQEVISNNIIEGVQGVNKIELNIENLPSGIYFAQILKDGAASTKRFMVEK